MKRLVFFILALIGLRRLLRPRNAEINGKVVIITGASAGIGRAAAYAFAREGGRLVLVARREAVLNALRDELTRTTGAAVLVIPADISSDGDLQHIVDATLNRYGRIDVLINNAGISLGGRLQDHDPATLRRMIEVNVYGLIRLTQLALPVMLAQTSGHIVNISSVAGTVMAPGEAAYASTKASINAFSRVLRREVARRGVHVAVVMPGWTRTEMIGKIEPQMRDVGLHNVFFPIFEVEAVAEAILQAVQQRRDEVYMAGVGFRFGSFMNRHFPRLTNIGMRLYFWRWERYLDVMDELGSQ